MPGQWVQGPGGKPVYQDAAGLVHLRGVDGKVAAVQPTEAHKLLSDDLSGFAPATDADINTQRTRDEWDKADGGAKAAFYARQATKGAIDAVTGLVRAPVALGTALASKVSGVPISEVYPEGIPTEALSGERLVEKMEQSAGGDDADLVRRYQEQQKRFADVAPGGTAANIAGSLITGGALSKAAGLVGEGAAAVTSSARVGKLAGLASEGAAIGQTSAAEDAWVKDEPLTADALLAHMGVGAILGAGTGAVVEGAKAVPAALADQARKVFGTASKRTAETALENSGHMTNEVAEGMVRDTVGVEPVKGVANKFRALMAAGRDKLEQAQSLATGIKKETLEKYGALRNTDEAINAQKMITDRPEIMDHASTELTDSLRSVHAEGGPIHDEVVNIDLKRQNLAPLLTGDRETMMAVAADKAAQLQEGLAKLDETTGPRGIPVFGKGRKVVDIRDAYETTVHDLLQAANPEDAIIALDKFKRRMQRTAMQEKSAAQRSVLGVDQAAARARQGLAEQASGDVLKTLENSEVWGKFGDAQKATNAAWTRMLDNEKYVASHIMEKVGENFGSGTRLDRFEVDPAKVSRFVESIGKPEGETLEKLLRANLAGRKELASAIVKLYGVTEHEAGLGALTASADKALSVLDRVKETAGGSNQLSDMMEKQHATHWASSATTLAGLAGNAVAGPLGGLAAAGIAHAAANPYTMIKQMAAMRQITQRFQSKIGAAVDHVVSGADTKAARHAGAFVASHAKSSAESAIVRQAAGHRKEQAVAAIGTHAYNAAVQNVVHANSDPIRQSAVVAQSFGEVAHPRIKDALIAKSQQVTAFLASKIPASVYEPGSPLSAQKLSAVSDTDREKFMGYYETALHPMTVLDSLKQGTVSPEQIDALKTLYPSMYGEIQMSIFNATHSKGVDLPYQKRMQLSEWFDQKQLIEPTMDPGFMLRLSQSVEAARKSGGAPGGQDGSRPKPPKSGGNIASSMASPLADLHI